MPTTRPRRGAGPHRLRPTPSSSSPHPSPSRGSPLRASCAELGSSWAGTTSGTSSSTCRVGTTICASCLTSVTSSGRRRGPSCRHASAVDDIRVEAIVASSRPADDRRLSDETGDIEATWFGRRFIERRLRAGQEIVVSGRLKRLGRRWTIDNPEFQVVRGRRRGAPCRPDRAGLSAHRRPDCGASARAIREALDRAGHAYPEYLPAPLRRGSDLIGIAEALESAHYPESFELRDKALRRLAFDELLALQLGMVGRRRSRGADRAPTIAIDDGPTRRSAPR